MPKWLIPMTYVMVSAVAGVYLPGLEHTYLPEYTSNMSVALAIAFLSLLAWA